MRTKARKQTRNDRSSHRNTPGLHPRGACPRVLGDLTMAGAKGDEQKKPAAPVTHSLKGSVKIDLSKLKQEKPDG